MTFGDSRKKKFSLSDLAGLDDKQQQGNFSSELATKKTLRKERCC